MVGSTLVPVVGDLEGETFEDECFFFDRLKSFFLRSFCSWASMIPKVDCYLIRYLFCSL